MSSDIQKGGETAWVVLPCEEFGSETLHSQVYSPVWSPGLYQPLFNIARDNFWRDLRMS